MNRQEDIARALVLFKDAISSLEEIADILRKYNLDFPVTRAYDMASNQAKALTYTMYELHKEIKNENTTTD